MKLLVFVTGFVWILVGEAAQPKKVGTRTGAALVQRIETTKGTCECVPYFDCTTENTVDTTIFRINVKPNATRSGTGKRIKRQYEERQEQCIGSTVCCLTPGASPKPEPQDPTTETPSSNTGAPCKCLPYWDCGKNSTEVINFGAGKLNKRIQSCNPEDIEEVLCCHTSFGESLPNTVLNATARLNETATRPTTPPPEPPLPRTCGTRYKNEDFNMVRIQTAGDGQTLFAEYPWTLAILKAEEDKEVKKGIALLCGASLIQDSVAITAAHCVENIAASGLKVRAGEWDTHEDNPKELIRFQERRVNEIIMHPGYNTETLHNDIAILKLDAPFIPADNIGLICLPREDTPDPTNCIATGWGAKAFGKNAEFQTIMKQVALPFVERKDCQTKLRKNTILGKYFIVHESFNCAGGVANEDTCTGDGGGPLACLIPGSDQFYLIGITSSGVECGKKDVPALYANVRHFSDWISSKL